MCKNKDKNSGRWFYKCADCLSVMAIDGRLESQHVRTATASGVTYAYRVGECGVCGGNLEEMGKVEGTALTQPGERCPCDLRCTSAAGPKCNCLCGGVNHGSHRRSQVDIVTGSVPRVTPPNDPAALARATEYRAAVAPLAELVANLRKRKAASWVDRDTYNLLQSRAYLLNKVRKCRTHSVRMKLLAEWAATLAAV